MPLIPLAPPPILLMTLSNGASLTNAIQQAIVPIPDPRLAVYFAIVFQRASGDQSKTPPGQKLGYIVPRVKVPFLQGASFPVAPLLGTANDNTGNMGALLSVTGITSGNPPQGYSREFQTAADEIFIDVRLNDLLAANDPGQWWLVSKYTPNEPMCDEEWVRLQQFCTPKSLTGQAGTSPT